jgi:glucose/mannose-6-phosphate isomerase
MENFILSGPDQLRQAQAATRNLASPSSQPERAFLLGMGGSALSAGLIDMLRYFQQSSWPWFVVRDYILPALPDLKSRVLALSYSGNTEEVLTTLESVAGRGASCLSVSSGGRLESLSKSHDIPWIQVPGQPPGFQPRFALYFMFGVAYEVLVRDGLLKREPALDVLADLLDASDFQSTGKDIADWLGARIPVVYTTSPYETGVARTWKIKFNENTKRPALAGAIPETNHNELIAFTPEYAGQFAFLLVPDPAAPDSVQLRFTLFQEAMQKAGYPVRTIPLTGSTALEKGLQSLLLADWVSYYAALKADLDPVSIPAIQEFKQKLSGSNRP